MDWQNQGVEVPHPAYAQMVASLLLVGDIVAGTKVLRERGEQYLPKYEAEDRGNYDRRKNRATLHNAFAETLGFLKGKVFTRPLEFKPEESTVVLPEIEALVENVDRIGNHLSIFAQQLFEKALRDGLAHVLVDMAPLPPQVQTKADEEALPERRRPYWVLYDAKQVIGWRSTLVNGQQVLTQVRILETVEEDAGEWGITTVDQVRVLDLIDNQCRVRVYREGEAGTGWEEQTDQAGFMAGPDGVPLDFIPFVTYYTHRTGFMTADPPLLDLAYQNIKHYQMSSDYDNGLTQACFCILVLRGYKGETDSFAIGPTTAIKFSDPQSTAEYVEPRGNAFASMRQRLQDLENEMQIYGLRLLVGRTGQTPTATGEAISEAKTSCELQAMAQGLIDCIELALDYSGRYLGLPEDTTGSISMDMDFSLTGNKVDNETLLKAAQANVLPKEVVWAEWKRRGLLAENSDFREFAALLESQAFASSAAAGLAGTFLQPLTAPPPAPQG